MSFGIGWLWGYAREWTNVGLMIDLDYVSNGGHYTFDAIEFKDVTVDIKTPDGVINIGELEFLGEANEGDSIVDSGFKIGVTTTGALMTYLATQALGPIGAVAGATFTEGIKELYEYVKDQQEESFGLNVFSSNHKQLWYNDLFYEKFFSLPYSKSHAAFIELLPATKGRCGAITFVFHGKLVLHAWIGIIPGPLWDYNEIEFETAITVPFFVPPG